MGKRKTRLGRVTDVEVRLLRIFQTVVHCNGLSAAEIALGIGRSTISTHIADLEARLGATLCQRGRSGFSLTAQGKKIYEASLRLMSSLDAFRDEANSSPDCMAGALNVGIVDNTVWDPESPLRRVFGEFSPMSGDVDLTLYILSPDELEHRLLDGQLHVGVGPVMHELDGLHYEALFEETNYLYCGRGHPLFERPDSEISTRELFHSGYVKKGYAVDRSVYHDSESMGKRVIGFHAEAFALLILSGSYIGFLPESYAANWETRGEMRRLLAGQYAARVHFAAMTARGKSATPAQTAFVELLCDLSSAAGPLSDTQPG
jgi:DNA-binding transcriptional LysR family regulator